jgi:eukaryotic-like serine/threonine-protein kinase
MKRTELKRAFGLYGIFLYFLMLHLPAARAQQPVLYRGDAQRTGSYSEQAIRSFNRVKWQVSVGEANHGGVVLAANALYVLSNAGQLAAIDSSTGNTIWTFKPKPSSPLFSPVAVSEGVVYVAQQKRLHALNAQTGKIMWSFKTKGLGLSSPLIAGSLIYFGCFDDNFYAVDKNTGKLKWRLKVGDTDTHAVFDDGTVYFESADFSINRSYLYAVDAETGQEKWKMERPVSESWTRPAIANGLLYIGQGNRFFAIDRTGTALWSYEGGNVSWSSPAIAGGIVYVGNQDGFVHALNSQTGELVWKFKSEDKVIADPIVSDGVVYFGVGNFEGREGPRNFIALDGLTGQELWKFQANGLILSPAAIGNRAVYFATRTGNSGTLYAIE